MTLGAARLSVERSVSLLLKSSQGIFAGRRCFTCHHNSLPAEAASLARRKGIPLHEEQVANNVRDILAVFRQAAAPAMQAQATFPGGIALTLGYGMMGLAAERHPLDKATAAMTHWILATQMPDGSWLGNGVSRPPMEFSTVSHTVIAARGLTLYPIPARRAQVDRALAKAREWLLSASAPSSEERAMRLLGLVWTKAPRCGDQDGGSGPRWPAERRRRLVTVDDVGAGCVRDRPRVVCAARSGRRCHR